MGGPDPPWEGAILRGKGASHCSIGTFCHELCRNGCAGQFAVRFVDSGGPKEAQVQSYSPGGANVDTWVGTLTPRGEYELNRSSAAAMRSYVKLF